MKPTTLSAYVDFRCEEHAEQIWLRDRHGDEITEWSWQDAASEIDAVACWIEKKYQSSQLSVAILSRNRAHWVIADLAIIGSRNVTIPLFTTLTPSVAQYILEFSETQLLILGEAENWAEVSKILPKSVEVITLPGVVIDDPHTAWDDIVAENRGLSPKGEPNQADLISLVFTSGTTGVPKGVMQNHNSFIVPMVRGKPYFGLRENPRFLSYLPLSHIAERQLVMVQSLVYGGSINFNESLATLLRDMADTRPNFFFGAPRVWELLQQGILAKMGSQQALDAAMAEDAEAVGLQIRKNLGFDDTDYLLTAAAPTPPALIEWYEKLGLVVMEGFGQTETMAVACNSVEHRRIGSIGRVVSGVELKISDEGELCFKTDGAAVGYYKMPDKSAETFVDGWVHTGDKGYIDDDGYVFLTGRVKDYFKTIQGKFVAPAPIENDFSASEWTEQVCLLGRGYSKTVIVCVLSDRGHQQPKEEIEASLLNQATAVNEATDKHARLGAVIISKDAWTIENELLTPTLKIRRDAIETRFGERAQILARNAAAHREIYIDWE